MSSKQFEAYLSLPFAPLLIIAATMSAAFLIMYLIKRIILGRISSAIIRSRFELDTLLVNSLNRPTYILILSVEFIILKHLLIHFEYDYIQLNQFIDIAILSLIVICIVVFINGFLTGLVSSYAKKSETLRSSETIVKGVTRTIILSLGLLVLLGTLGISVTPIIASLGITSLAVALALQPTLENFFSGVQLVIDKPIRVDDYIELDSGEQGFVKKIGWRSTWIQMLPNNTVIIPNSNLCNAKIINYFYPEKELSVPVEVGVHYDSDLDHVEQVTLEVARSILISHEYGVDEYNTFILFHTFDSSSINFTVMLRAKEYFNRFFLKSAFIKELHKRYAQEGIVIPYPIRAINTTQESARDEVAKSN
ncbi:mechanosensitive ion channel family protein [Marinicellulosiphila megalodicopiae]|uniref:mechanosensitive ion channel family protein n=1 Tax=Marinicellulosiphila megalodicopiae TaxID=2724896 RepID=UPI003BB00A37